MRPLRRPYWSSSAWTRPSRRRFLAGLAGLGVGAGLGAWGAVGPDGAPPTALAPTLGDLADLPPYHPPGGPDLRPATYLLQEAGERAFASSPRAPRPRGRVSSLLRARPGRPRAPVLRHEVWDWIDMSGRAVDGLGRLRLITGITTRPRRGSGGAGAAAGPAGWGRAAVERPVDRRWRLRRDAVEIFSQSRGLLGLTTWYGLTGSERLEAALEAAVRG